MFIYLFILFFGRKSTFEGFLPFRYQWHPDLPIRFAHCTNWWQAGAQTEVRHFWLCQYLNTKHTGGRKEQNSSVSHCDCITCFVASGTCVWMEITWAHPFLWMSSCASDTSALLSCRKHAYTPWGNGCTHKHTHTLYTHKQIPTVPNWNMLGEAHTVDSK